MRAGETLETPWDQLTSILDAIDEMVYVADPETFEILYANPAKRRLFGENIVGRKCYDAFQGLDSPCDFCTNPMIFGRHLGKTHTWEFQNRKSGNWVRCIDRAIRWSDGRTVRFELAIDIHDRKVAEQALMASEQKYRQLVENIHEVIYAADTIGTITYVSPAIQSLTGYSPSEIEGRHFSEFIYHEDAEYLMERYGNALSGQARPAEYRLQAKSGGYRWVRTFTTPVRAGDELIGLQGVLSDITDLKETEEALKERERDLTNKTEHLEEVNAALRVLIEKREKDKDDLEEQVLRNVKQLVNPYIEKLKKMADGTKQKAYLDVIEKNLEGVTSAFSKDLSFRYQSLTPTELQIAALIREGKSTKQIAEVMNVSSRTVESHRKNVRKKMGLREKKGNLRTTLLSIK